MIENKTLAFLFIIPFWPTESKTGDKVDIFVAEQGNEYRQRLLIWDYFSYCNSARVYIVKQC